MSTNKTEGNEVVEEKNNLTLFGIDMDSETVNEIMELLSSKSISVGRAKKILEKLSFAINLTELQWEKREIPSIFGF